MKSNLKISKIIAGFIVATVAVIIFTQAPGVFAQTPTSSTEGDAGGFVICGRTVKEPCQIGHLFAAFVIIINYLITMAGFVAVLAIIYAGFMMVYSQGQEQLTAAKGRLTGAIIGLVLVAAAFVLINSIFSGTFSIGVCNGHSVLTSPLDYIKDVESCKAK